MPKVSILLPTYNGCRYVRRSIESVLNQSYKDWELIVIDDASSDDMGSTIKDFINSDSRIIFKKNDHNLGLAGNLNKGLSLSNGEFIARIDQDDIWIDLEKLSNQTTFLDTHPEYELVGTGYEIVRVDSDNRTKITPVTDDSDIRKIILSQNPFGHSTVMFRKKTVIELGGYDISIPYGEDYDLWLRLGLRGKFANLPTTSMRYLAQKSSMSGNHDTWKQIKFQIKLLKRYGLSYPGLLWVLSSLSIETGKITIKRLINHA